MRHAEITGWPASTAETAEKDSFHHYGPMSEAAGDSDWLLSLASRAVATDGANSSKSSSHCHPTLSKAERIERRRRKNAEREQRRKQAIEKKRSTRRNPDQATANTASMKAKEPRPKKKNEGFSRASKRTLHELAARVSEAHSSSFEQAPRKTTKRKARDQGDECVTLKNGVSAEPKGKATKQSTLRHDSKELQPRARDYNGQGLARPSIFLQLNDPSFLPKLELEFGEHIEGFFGRAKTKSAKKQEARGMLWKRCLDDSTDTRENKKKRIDKIIMSGDVM